ncbi:peptidase M16 [Filimonas zeae]|uniref:Peptidase M16 n=2 Tax=Filimonas zeae TaxID=1737353 RepID=A0A917MUG9_9BACT|nr:peptidase M16 [Filimonas zeae]
MLAVSGMLHVCSQELMLDSKVRTGHLPNGFSYYIRHNNSPEKRALFYLAVKAGSILETHKQQGLAHFVEHMSFNGTTHFKKNELVDYLQKSGIRFGADLNAYTGFDETVYKLPVPSDNPVLVAKAFEVIRDWAQEAQLETAEIDKERGVILEEKRLGKGAQERMQRVYWPVILNHSRYAYRMPIGNELVLKTFRPQEIRSFYRDWYRPDLQAIIIVGDVDVDLMEKQVKLLFSDLKTTARPRERTAYRIPLTGESHFVKVTDREMASTEVRVLIKHQRAALKTVNDYRAWLVREIFNRLMAQRLYRLNMSATAPFIKGEIGVEEFIGGLDSYSLNLSARPGAIEQGFKALWLENKRAVQFGFTEEEIERVKRDYLTVMRAAFLEKGKQSSDVLMNDYLGVFLHEKAAPGIEEEYRISKDMIPAISSKEISEYAKSVFSAANRDLLLLAPEKDAHLLPDSAAFVRWMAEVEKADVTPYQEEKSALALLDSLPAQGEIVKQLYDDTTQITTLILGNGAKVILKPTAFRDNEILISAYAAGGTSLYSDSDFQSATEAANIIHSFGVGNLDQNGIQSFMAGKQISVSPFITERAQGIRGASTKEDLESALLLMHATFTSPRMDTTVFNGMMAKAKASMMNRWMDPGQNFQDSVLAVLGKNNIRRTGPSLKKLKQIRPERSLSIYRERFADASNFTFLIAGSINVDSIRPLVAKYIASLPSLYRFEQARDLGLSMPSGVIRKTYYRGLENKVAVRIIYSGACDFTIKNALHISALKECLQIRLLERLREQEGGVYAPAVSANVSKLPSGRYSISIGFGCSTENVERLIAATREEVSRMVQYGPSRENLQKYQAEELMLNETQLTSNAFWMGYLERQVQNGEAFGEIYSYPEIIKRITQKDIQETAVKCMNGSNYMQFVLMPETEKNNN